MHPLNRFATGNKLTLETNTQAQGIYAIGPSERIGAFARFGYALTDDIDLRAEASGIVEFVAVREGDRVVEGQELVRLDSKLAKAALEQAARAFVEIAQAVSTDIPSESATSSQAGRPLPSTSPATEK